MEGKDKGQYTLWRNIIRSLGYFWRVDKWSFIAYLVLAVIQIASSLLAVFFTSRIIGGLAQAITNQSVDKNTIYKYLAGLALSGLAEAVAWRWMSFVERKSWIKFYVQNYLDYNSAVERLDMPQHHNKKMQNMLAKLQQGYANTPSNFSYNILNLIHASARMISVLIIVVNFAPWLFGLMIIALIPQFLVEKRLSKLQWGLWADQGDRWRLAWRTAHYLSDKDRLQETKIFGLKNFLLGILERNFSSFYGEQLKNIKSVQAPVFGTLVLDAVVLIGINFWLINKVLNHALSLANFSFYVGIISQLGSSLTLIVRSMSTLYDDNQLMQDLYKFYDTQPVLPQPNKPFALNRSVIPVIEFKNVSFKYPESKKFVLKNISFTLNPADKIALVGENGAGKTTLIKLLLRFYDVDEGEILINDVNIKQLDLRSYYDHICVLFQNFSSYPYSVRDNIALGRVEKFKDNSLVKKAAKKADADKFINDYPLRYDQILEIGFEDGIEPSGGQWQRIALARALFRDAGILILDEPTAAVDAKAEYAIFKTLDEHSADKTTIIISHRFSTVRKAHKILVIEEGRIIERGTHSELLKIRGGHYKEMFEKQAEGYR